MKKIYLLLSFVYFLNASVNITYQEREMAYDNNKSIKERIDVFKLKKIDYKDFIIYSNLLRKIDSNTPYKEYSLYIDQYIYSTKMNKSSRKEYLVGIGSFFRFVNTRNSVKYLFLILGNNANSSELRYVAQTSLVELALESKFRIEDFSKIKNIYIKNKILFDKNLYESIQNGNKDGDLIKINRKNFIELKKLLKFIS